jgi:hypothetical protein
MERYAGGKVNLSDFRVKWKIFSILVFLSEKICPFKLYNGNFLLYSVSKINLPVQYTLPPKRLPLKAIFYNLPQSFIMLFSKHIRIIQQIQIH